MKNNIKISELFTYADEPLDYKIVQGFPVDVEEKVQVLIAIGWELGGDMYIMKAPGEDIDIVVQCMVLYKKPIYS